MAAERQVERQAAFSAVSHDYVAQRALVEAVPEDALRRPTAVPLDGSAA